jgi:hypothetical protein
VQAFAAWDHLDVQTLGALPFAPSLWKWDGLIRTPHGVYELRMDLSDQTSLTPSPAANSSGDPSVEYRFYPEAFSNSYIEAARRLPEVQKVLWFARFPVTRFRKEGSEAVVEISDMRFVSRRPGRIPSFTYRVRFADDGGVLSQGWVRP